MRREVQRPGASARRRADALVASLPEFPFALPPQRREDPIAVFLATRPIDPLRDTLGKDLPSRHKSSEHIAPQGQE